jgi:hypothetical protein
VAAILLVLFLVTFLFHTGVGLCFLGLAIVVLVKNGASKKLKVVRGERASVPQPAWTDPWRTENLR